MSDRHARRMAPRLSALRDGDLGSVRAALVRRHLLRCARCQAIFAALDAQVVALGSLQIKEPLGRSGPHDATEEAGWGSLQAALRQRGAEERRTPRRRLGAAPLLLSACGVAAALYVAVPRLQAILGRAPSDEVLVARAAAEFQQAELHYERAIEQLLRASARVSRDRGSPEGRAYEARLAALGQATAARRALLLSRPADADAQEELYAAYRSQIAFLQGSLRRRPSAVMPIGLPGGAL